MTPYAKEFLFSKHYKEGKDIDTELAIQCIHTGKKTLDEEPNKFKSRKKYRCGELIVIYEHFEGARSQVLSDGAHPEGTLPPKAGSSATEGFSPRSVHREYEDYFFVITAFWNVRGDKG